MKPMEHELGLFKYHTELVTVLVGVIVSNVVILSQSFLPKEEAIIIIILDNIKENPDQ